MKEIKLATQHGLSHRGTPICNFSVGLSNIYYWADGPAKGSLAFLRLVITTDTARYEELIQATGYSRLSFLRRHPDLSVTRKGLEILDLHIAGLVADRIRESDTGLAFSQTGFHHLENRTVFVAGNRLIGGEDLDVIFAPEISNFHLTEAVLPPREISEELLNRLQANNPEIAVPVFSFGILTALQSLMLECGIPLTSVLYLNGQSGLGKTETVKKFFALYDFTKSKLPALITEAGSTMAGFRENLRSARDLQVVLDDLCLSSAKYSQRKRLEIGAQVIREASNKGAMRIKAGDHGTESSTEAGVAITAEFNMRSISDVTRCIIVTLERPMDGGKSDDRTIAAGALDAFLTWFIPRYQQEKEHLEQRYNSLQTKGRLDRLKTGLFYLYWAFDCFMRFVRDTGAMTASTYNQVDQFWKGILQQIEHRQRQLIACIDAKIPKFSIQELLWAGIQNHAIPLVNKPKKLDSFHGLIKGNDFFLPPLLLDEFLSNQDGYQSITRTAISRELKAAGILVLHKNDHANTVKSKKGGPRVLHIRLDLLRKNVERIHGL